MTRLLLLGAVLLGGCAVNPYLPVKQCEYDITVHPVTGALGRTTGYPCWEHAKDSETGKKTRLLHLMGKSGDIYTQEVGP